MTTQPAAADLSPGEGIKKIKNVYMHIWEIFQVENKLEK